MMCFSMNIAINYPFMVLHNIQIVTVITEQIKMPMLMERQKT